MYNCFKKKYCPYLHWEGNTETGLLCFVADFIADLSFWEILAHWSRCCIDIHLLNYSNLVSIEINATQTISHNLSNKHLFLERSTKCNEEALNVMWFAPCRRIIGHRRAPDRSLDLWVHGKPLPSIGLTGSDWLCLIGQHWAGLIHQSSDWWYCVEATLPCPR